MPTTRELSEAIATVGAALRELPLETLPGIASIGVRGFVPPPSRVELQLGSRGGPADPLAWAGVIRGATAAAEWGSGFIRVEVTGSLARVPVTVWDHISGELTAAARVLGLSADREDHTAVAVPMAALRQLGAQGVPCDA